MISIGQPAGYDGWIKTFSKDVLASRPALDGRISWAYANRCYDSGLNPWAAAARYLDYLRDADNE